MPSAGRTSMPTTLPVMPWIFQVLVTFLALVSTIEIVLSPESAATWAACAAGGAEQKGRRGGQDGPKLHVTLPWVRCRPIATTAGYGAGGRDGCAGADKIIVRPLHPIGGTRGIPHDIGPYQDFS